MIKSLQKVFEAIDTDVRIRLEQGHSQTQVRREMKSALKDPGKLGYLDAKCRELALQVTEHALVKSLMGTIAENGSREVRTANDRAVSALNNSHGAAHPSRSSLHPDLLGKSLDRSRKARAIADQATAVSRVLSDLTDPGGPGRVSFPLRRMWRTGLADAPLSDLIRVGVAYAKGQLAMWRAVDPDLMRCLTERRDRAAKPARTRKTVRGGPSRDRLDAFEASDPGRRGTSHPRPDAIQNLATLATVSDPQPDSADPHPGIDPAGGATNCPRPGDVVVQHVVIADHELIPSSNGDDPSYPTSVAYNQ